MQRVSFDDLELEGTIMTFQGKPMEDSYRNGSKHGIC
jgi:hypothetical protein